ncbi:hypothetical protein NL676_002474 [Syzygium grande]|nr:hypothetical protein NL676_002474 [Syzygium grande]
MKSTVDGVRHQSVAIVARPPAALMTIVVIATVVVVALLSLLLAGSLRELARDQARSPRDPARLLRRLASPASHGQLKPSSANLAPSSPPPGGYPAPSPRPSPEHLPSPVAAPNANAA